MAGGGLLGRLPAPDIGEHMSDNLPAIVGANVREWREFRRMTQSHLAQAAGISRQMVSRIEQGTVNITVDTLVRLSAALSVEYDEILK